jgi:hypothetical protein
VREVQDALVVGVRVDRRHQALDDAEVLVEDLRHRRHTVGGAGGVGDDVVVRRVVLVLVDAHDDGDVLVLGRSRNEDLLGATGQVLRGVFLLREDAGRLDDDVDAQLAPRDVGGVALGEDLDGLAVDGDRVGGVGDLLLEAAQDGVVLQQVSGGRGVTQVVDSHDLDVSTLLQQRAEVVTTDAAKAVDAYADRHETDLLVGTPVRDRRAVWDVPDRLRPYLPEASGVTLRCPIHGEAVRTRQ